MRGDFNLVQQHQRHSNLRCLLEFFLSASKELPVESIMGERFGIGQSQANEWIHTLLPILKQALDDLGYEPERDPKKIQEK